MARNINLDIDTIMNKEFNVDFKGYSPIEVDQFLDLVAKDYDAFLQNMNEYHDKLVMVQEANEKLKARNLELEEKLKSVEEERANTSTIPSVNNLSQVDILRRLARLEQEVFNKK